ncbi:hypothetical protein ACWD6N_03375 [Micromonospora sp. NPDC005163]
MTHPTDPRAEQPGIPQQAGGAPSGFITTEAPAATPPRREARRWPWMAAAALVVLLAAGGVAYALMPTDEDEAVDRCQTAISGQLKSPSTAKYADGVTVTGEDGNFGTYYEVSGEVDAQNGFGALVRGDYRCKVQRESGGGWLVTESSFNQR